MNLKQLEVFIAVAETGSFSKGADATFITQSTVSQHISALEKEFGLRLLDRTGKGALLTEGGKLLLQHAQQLLANTRSLVQAMNRFKGIEHSNLTIGGSNIPGDYILPDALPALISRFPSLAVTVLHGDSREILDKLDKEEIELGVIGTWFDNDDILFTPLGQDHVRLVVGKQHRWQKRKAVDPEELQEEKYVLREPGSGTGKTIREALSLAGINISTFNVKACLGSNESIKKAVINGLGISFIPEISMKKEMERGELFPLDIKGVDFSRHLYLVQRAGRQLSPAAAAFAEVICGMYGLDK